MAHGKLVLLIDNGKDKGRISTFEYDDAARSMGRARTLDRLLSCIVGWQGNYVPYRDASFTVREVKADEDGLFGRKVGRVIDLEKELAKLPKKRLNVPSEKANGAFKSSARAQARRAAKRKAKKETGSKANWKDFIDEI